MTSKKQLQEKIDRLVQDSAYGCYNRAGMEIEIWPKIADQIEFIVACDIDGMHNMNERYGHKEMNRRITIALTMFRSTDVIAARIESGDEMAGFCKSQSSRQAMDPAGLARRMEEVFALQGITITTGYCERIGLDFVSNIERAFEQVEINRKALHRSKRNK